MFQCRSGVKFFLNNDPIPSDGSGLVMITSISVRNGAITDSDTEALICRSSKDVAQLNTLPNTGDWFINSEVTNTTDETERINGDGNRGWQRNRGRIENYVYYRVVRLKRVSERAEEGKFTCHIPNDDENNKSLLILYPSKSIKVPYTTVVLLLLQLSLWS